MNLFLQGEFLQIATPQDPPFTPPPFPDPSNYNDSKMIYVIASKYVAESASYAFWKAGLMVYNISSEQARNILLFNFYLASILF